MCGIAGIIGRLDEANCAALKRMSGAMLHRGPDDDGAGSLNARRPDGPARCSRFAGSPSSTSRRPGTSRCWSPRPDMRCCSTARSTTSAPPRAPRGRGPHPSAPPAMRRRSLLRRSATQGAPGAGAASGACSRSPSWDPVRADSSWRGTRWASSRCTWRGRSTRCAGWSLAFASELRALLASGLLGTPRLDPAAAASAGVERVRGGAGHRGARRRDALARELRIHGEDGSGPRRRARTGPWPGP